VKIHFQKSLRKARAFTLVEVVISVAILGIAAAGLMGCLNYAFFVMKMARENLRATQIMLERAEAIRLWRWDRMISGPANVPPTFTENYDPTPGTEHPGVTYSGTVSIDPFPDNTVGYAASMKQITITLQWKTGNVTRNRTNVTYVAKDGIQNYVY
jgi:prepilin-type N-terminal cleavage/methylation domain-containing protein